MKSSFSYKKGSRRIHLVPERQFFEKWSELTPTWFCVKLVEQKQQRRELEEDGTESEELTEGRE